MNREHSDINDFNPLHSIVRSIAVLGAVLFIATPLFYYVHFNRSTSPAPLTGSEVLLAVGPVPASPLYRIDSGSKTLVPVMFGQGTTSTQALDRITDADGSVYSIRTSTDHQPISNLFVERSDGSLEQLTNSATAKFNLSLGKNGILAYQSLKIASVNDFITKTDWNIVTYDPSLKKETQVAIGNSPSLLYTSDSVLFRSGTTLKSVNLFTHKTADVLTLGRSGIFAISPEGKTLVQYNSVTNAVDLYDFSNGSYLSYVRSYTVSSIPLFIAYLRNELVGVYVKNDQKEFSYVITNLAQPTRDQITVPGIPQNVPFRIYEYK